MIFFCNCCFSIAEEHFWKTRWKLSRAARRRIAWEKPFPRLELSQNLASRWNLSRRRTREVCVRRQKSSIMDILEKRQKAPNEYKRSEGRKNVYLFASARITFWCLLSCAPRSLCLSNEIYLIALLLCQAVYFMFASGLGSEFISPALPTPTSGHASCTVK
jgi:hypothetical protein